jgi:hypothetical protein
MESIQEKAKEQMMSDVYMTYEDWLRGCVHHDGRHGYVNLPCDEVLKIADFIERLRADRKTENCSVFPNNSTVSKMEQVDKDINVRSKDEPQYDFGEYADRLWKIAYERGKREALEQTEPSCDTCKLKGTTEWCKKQEVCRAYKPKDEPQTDEPKWTCERCGFENYANFKWCFHCGFHKPERSE